MDEKTVARFWQKVDKSGPAPEHRPELGPCWIWTSYLATSGYGRFFLNGRPQSAHRISFGLAFGAFSLEAFICHSCDVRKCVRPEHLFLGDALVNHADMVAKGRRANHLGEAHGRAKITDAQARQILALRGLRTQEDLAAEFGITQPCVSRIHRRKGWTHI